MYYFTWSVPEKGFHWVKEDKTLILHEVPGSLEFKNYHPMEDFPELFLTFSKLKTADDIIKFANRYGCLWGNWNYVRDITPRDVFEDMVKRGQEVPPPVSEYLTTWLVLIKDMRLMVELWDNWKKGHLIKLGARIIWQKGEVLFYRGDLKDKKKNDYIKIADNKDHYPHHFYNWKKGDVIGPVKSLLQTEINRQLRRGIQPQITFDASGSLQPYIMPDSLSLALWLQLYFAVTGIKKFIQCDICKEWMPVSDKNRSTKKRHESCRKLEWAHKQKVLRLWNEGKSIDEIINESGLETKKITKWLEEKL